MPTHFTIKGPSRGVKRLCFLLLIAAPLVSAEPISMMQEFPAYFSSLPIRYMKTVKVETPFFETVYFGVASWYSEKDKFINKHTANGEVFDDQQMTCASWSFKFGTMLEVKNLYNGKSIVCRVNDRGPNKRLNRLIDLTKAAFKKLDGTHRGLIPVTVREISS